MLSLPIALHRMPQRPSARFVVEPVGVSVAEHFFLTRATTQIDRYQHCGTSRAILP